MRSIIPLLCMVVGCGSPGSEPLMSPIPELANQVELVDSDWSRVVAERLRLDPLQVWSDEEGLGLSNAGADLFVQWTPTGVQIEKMLGEHELPLEGQISTTGVGRGVVEPVLAGLEQIDGCSGVGVDAFGACLQRVSRPLGNGVVEWWANRPEGLEQGWTVPELPGAGDLRIELEVTGFEVQILDATNARLVHDQGSFGYRGLHAWDARGAVLPAHLESAASGLEIVVDVQNAAWPVTVDPLCTSPDWTEVGSEAEGGFGASVSDAGDVNADGFDDVLIGMPAADVNGNEDAGRVYAYYGSAQGLPVNASWTRGGGARRDAFGAAIAGVGDVDGDGDDDVLIGAPAADPGGKNKAGRVYLYKGSNSGLAGASWTEPGENPRDGFGTTLSRAGDVNADGFDDVIIGAPAAANGFIQGAGAVYVFLGRTQGLQNNHAWRKRGSNFVETLGSSVTGGGDFDGDGKDDVAVGAAGQGRVQAYRGNNGGVANNHFWQMSRPVTQGYGLGLDLVGDMNNDGFDDLAVGAPGASANGTSQAGRAFVYRGFSGGLRTTANWTGFGSAANEGFGARVAGAGDVDGDGFDDLLVGAQRVSLNGQTSTSTGFVELFMGRSWGVVATPWWTFVSPETQDGVGGAISTAGDLDGNGTADIVVGAPGAHAILVPYDGPPVNPTPPPVPSPLGEAHVFYGTRSDDDGDGFIDEKFPNGDDCNDDDAAINPGAADLTVDGIDQDCDGIDGVLLEVEDLAEGDILITEIHDNPASVAAPDGVWVELLNTTAQYVELEGLNLEHQGILVGAPPLAPGAYFVIGHQADDNGGVAVDYVMSSLTGSPDALILRTPAGQRLDRFRGRLHRGASWGVDALDQQCMGRSVFGAGDFGTPGAANDSCDWELEATFSWSLAGEQIFHGPVTVSFLHDGSFSTNNSGRGTWSLSTNGPGQRLRTVNTDTGVVWNDRRGFGESCWSSGVMLQLPNHYTGSWDSCP